MSRAQPHRLRRRHDEGRRRHDRPPLRRRADPKDDLRTEAYGTIDEAVAALGIARANLGVKRRIGTLAAAARRPRRPDPALPARAVRRRRRARDEPRRLGSARGRPDAASRRRWSTASSTVLVELEAAHRDAARVRRARRDRRRAPRSSSPGRSCGARSGAPSRSAGRAWFPATEPHPIPEPPRGPRVGLGARGRTGRIAIRDPGPTAGRRRTKGDNDVSFQQPGAGDRQPAAGRRPTGSRRVASARS